MTLNHGIIVCTHTDVGATIKGVSRVKIRWVGTGLTPGDGVLLSDADGNKVWEAVTATANILDSFILDLHHTLDLVLTTLDGGTLYIYSM